MDPLSCQKLGKIPSRDKQGALLGAPIKVKLSSLTIETVKVFYEARGRVLSPLERQC